MDVAGVPPVVAPVDGAGPRERTWAAALGVIVAGVLLELALLAAIPFFVTTDGAAHVDGAEALSHLLFGGPSAPYTTLSWLPATNLLPEIPMAALAVVFGAPASEKLVIAGWIVLLPVALWYAVTGVRRGAGWLAVFALPLTFGLMLHLGFYSFCYASLLFLAVAGYHARHRDRLGGRQVAVLAVLLALTYATHAFVFLAAGLLLAVLEAWTWAVRVPRRAADLGRRLARVAIASLPGVLLVLLALVANPGRGSSAAADAGPPIEFQVRAFLEAALWVRQLAVFDHLEALPAFLLFALLLGMGSAAVVARRGSSRVLRDEDGYLAYAAVLLLGVLLVPDAFTLGAGGAGAFINNRLATFVTLAGVLWLAAFPFGVRIRWATIVTSLVVAIALIGIRLPWTLRLSDQAMAFASLAPCVAHGATMAQVNLSRYELPSNRTDQIENETGRLSAITGGLDLGDAELGDRVHLARYRDDVDPYRHLRQPGGLPDTVDPVIDPARYRAQTGASLDYVLVFGRPDATPEVLASADWQRLEVQLASDYRRVAVDADGRLELWERLGGTVASEGEAARAASPSCAQPAGG